MTLSDDMEHAKIFLSSAWDSLGTSLLPGVNLVYRNPRVKHSRLSFGTGMTEAAVKTGNACFLGAFCNILEAEMVLQRWETLPWISLNMFFWNASFKNEKSPSPVRWFGLQARRIIAPCLRLFRTSIYFPKGFFVMLLQCRLKYAVNITEPFFLLQ